MATKVTHRQEVVPLDRQNQPDQAQKSKAAKNVQAGQLGGDNLQIMRDGNQNALPSQQAGAPRPALTPPYIQPDAAGFEAAMNSFNALLASGALSAEDLELQVAQAGQPANAMPGGEGAQQIAVQQSPHGFFGALDGGNFDVDLNAKSMQLDVGQQTVNLQFTDEENVRATLDGESFFLGEDEVGALTHFFVLMSLFHTMGVEQRQMNREGRNMANKEVVAKIKEQAEEQRSAAAAKLAAGVVSGTVKMASASLTMVGSMKGLKADQAAAQAGVAGRPGDMISQQWRAMGQMVEGLGEAGASSIQYQAGLHEARATELRGGEEQARFVKQSEQDQMQVQQDLTTKARDAFQQVWNQYLQTQQSIARNI